MAETTRSVRPIPLSDKRQPSDETEVKVGSKEFFLITTELCGSPAWAMGFVVLWLPNC
jgi:hypothetical protein